MATVRATLIEDLPLKGGRDVLPTEGGDEAGGEGRSASAKAVVPTTDDGPPVAFAVKPGPEASAPAAAVGPAPAALPGGDEPPSAPGDFTAFINEFHYDNPGADTGEFVEIIIPTGSAAADYSIVRYNGSNGAPYTSPAVLSTTTTDLGGGRTALLIIYAVDGLQNGSPDALALVGPGGVLLEFISYEGGFVGVGGPADGVASVDVGVSEPGTAGGPTGTSIARTGSGDRGSDFTWVYDLNDTPGVANNGQTFTASRPQVAISPPTISLAEGVAGATTAYTYTVTRTGPTTVALSVGFAVTGSGLNPAGAADFGGALPNGTVTIPAGKASATFTISVNGDATAEADEGFTVTITPPAGFDAPSGTATGVIQNDDAALPSVTVAATDATATEGSADSGLAFTFTRTGDTSSALTVAFGLGGTATSGSDYTGPTGTATFAAGSSTATIAYTVTDDTIGEGAETVVVTLTAAAGYAVGGQNTATGTIGDNDFTLISAIQGTAHFSPILAAEGIGALNQNSLRQVTVQAVVTAIASGGFYLMEEQSDWDADARTSEGIFVSGAVPAGLTVGELVTVAANVREDQLTVQGSANLPRTVLVNATVTQSNTTVVLPTYVLDGSPGRAIPNSILTDEVPDYLDSVDDPNDVFDPTNDALDFFETIEGMRVTIPNMVVADGLVDGAAATVRFKAYSTTHADADAINSRGGYTISGDPALSPPDTADTQDGVIRGGRHVHDGDVNPDILELDFATAAGGVGGTSAFAGLLSMGDRLGDVTGVINFDFQQLKLVVTEALDPARVAALGANTPTQETTTLTPDARSLRVATFNVENLAFTSSEAKYDGIVAAIKDRLLSPDILCIEEIQDDNGPGAGGTSAAQTWQRLVDKLNAATGKTYQWVDQDPANNADGGAPNGNIRVGFLYDTGRVQLGDLAADASLADRRKYVDRIGDGVRDAGDLIGFSDDQLGAEIVTTDWTTTRKSLLGEFTFNGNKVYVTANHFPSKLGSGQFWQFNQNIDTGEPANSDWAQRNQLGQDVWAMMNLINARAPQSRQVLAGDFNEFYFYRAAEALSGFVLADGTARVGGARFTNLMVSELPLAERYTLEFAGRSQGLDYVFSDSALAAVADYDIVHLNTGFNSRGGSPAVSDHDPSLARFDFRNFSEILFGGPLAELIEGFGGDDVIFGGAQNDGLNGGAGADLLNGEEGNDTLVGGAGSDLISGEVGDDRLFGGADGDVLLGAEGADLLNGETGDDALFGGGGADLMSGEEGNDSLYGDAGADILIGGAGRDSFIYRTAGDSSLGGGVDIIADFTRGQDVVDISRIDADALLAGDQAFAFVSAFTGRAGQATLTYQQTSNRTVFSGDMDGDGVADLVIVFVGQVGQGDGFVL